MPLEQVAAWRTSDGQIFDREVDAEREQFHIDIINATYGEFRDRNAINTLWGYRVEIATIFHRFLPKTSDITFSEF